jgi:hypothetical protein
MSTLTVGLSRFTAVACATVITVVSAWAFMKSTASIERDPFQFASTMAANAKVRVAQLQSHSASTCRNKSETTDCPAS